MTLTRACVVIKNETACDHITGLHRNILPNLTGRKKGRRGEFWSKKAAFQRVTGRKSKGEAAFSFFFCQKENNSP